MLFLQDVSYTFDIVLSDFGRASTVRLLQILERGERAIIQQLLDAHGGHRGAPFFDEYRRIMFACVGDVAYIKQDLLSEKLSEDSLLDSSVLYGVGGTGVSTEAIGRIANIVAAQVEQAFERGYRRFRLVIPCNTLAIIDNDLPEILQRRLPKIDVKPSSMNGNGHARKSEKDGELTIFTVPRVVLKYIKKRYLNAKLTLVGTSLAQEEYATALKELGMETISIIDFTREEQKIMDELLVAAIGGDERYVEAKKRELRQKVLTPSERFGQPPIIIEASTDFDLGIGFNSLNLLAEVLLDDVYGYGSAEKVVEKMEGNDLRGGNAAQAV